MIIRVLFLVGLLVFPLSARSQQGFSGVVSFGDSLSDLGNTVAALTPFGEPFVREQSGYNAVFYFNGRFSNGPLWSERLNDSLGLGAMLRNNGSSVKTGTNFAWAGSTSGTGSTNFLLPNLLTQVGFYNTQLGESNPALPAASTTLFTIWSGGNDVINLVDKGTPITSEQVAANISTAITNIYNSGGRQFLVPNLPPLGYKPDFLSNPTKFTVANTFVDSYNLLLENELNLLSGNLAGSTIIRLNIHSIFMQAINDPASFGLTNVTDPAYTPFSGSNPPYPYGSVVPNPDQYLFWDNSHGTNQINSLIAQAAYAAVVPEPSVGWMLFIAAWIFLLQHLRGRLSSRDWASQPGRARV